MRLRKKRFDGRDEYAALAAVLAMIGAAMIVAMAIIADYYL